MKKDGEPGQYIDLDKNTRVLSAIGNATTVEEAYRKVNEVEAIGRGAAGHGFGGCCGSSASRGW